MIDNQQKEKLLRLARLIATVYLVSTGVFAVLAYFLPQRLDPPVLYEPSGINTLTLILGLMAFVGSVLGFVLPARIIRTSKQISTPGQKFFISTVLGCALFETPAICGLVLAFIDAALPVSLGFIIASAGFMLYTFPTEEKISHFLSTIPK
ncbi:MAG: hypothetical protein JSW02_02830 [candidate division WOR-3 bacterium]|nr:MAG: hypothetical protein JSW02_02830 [candidate division WOR-3 bacterium]